MAVMRLLRMAKCVVEMDPEKNCWCGVIVSWSRVGLTRTAACVVVEANKERT